MLKIFIVIPAIQNHFLTVLNVLLFIIILVQYIFEIYSIKLFFFIHRLIMNFNEKKNFLHRKIF